MTSQQARSPGHNVRRQATCFGWSACDNGNEVLDAWFVREVQPRLRGESFLVRYADDDLIVCALEEDARRIMDVLPKRLARFGLTLHPDKTRLVGFVRPARPPAVKGDNGQGPGTFNFLGFTHYWGPAQKGGWVVKRKTAKDRFSRALKKIAQWCRRYRHAPIDEQHQTLARKLRGHDAYYGITGNGRALQRFRRAVTRIWRRWLDRRGGKTGMIWERFVRILGRYPLPRARVVHSVMKPRVANP